MRMTGNTILITGGATGIGFGLARELAAKDNVVIICGRREDRLNEAKAKIPSLHTRVCDVADPESRGALAAWVVEKFPAFNILVNNAGVQNLVRFGEGMRDLAAADEEIAINLTAPIHLSGLLMSHLLAKKDAAIVNVSSGLAFAPLARVPVYCATKAALHSLTMTLRHQLKSTSVKVFELIPPIVTSELGAAHRPAQVNASAMPTDAAVAEMIEALANDRFEAPIGAAARLMEKREALFDGMNSHP
jgi:uncharacterized oxidoreductase